MIKRLEERKILESKRFQIKEVDIEFSSGEKATHEIVDSGIQGVTVVPITKDGNVLLVREYLTGANEYQLGLCKGGIEKGATPEETADRELQEEVGYKAGRLDKLGDFFLHPAYTTAKTHIFLARNLKESKLVGDEVEELEVVPYPFKDFVNLIDEGKLHDVRIIAALYLAKRFMDNERD